MEKSFEKIQAHINEYDEPTKEVIKGINFLKSQLGEIESMRRTTGWKIIEAEIRELLHNRILSLVKDEEVVKTLISLLTITSVKKQTKALEAEIDNLLANY